VNLWLEEMSFDIEVFDMNKQQLVRVLSSLSAKDFLDLSKELQKHRVISKDSSDILASLDHDNLDSKFSQALEMWVWSRWESL